MTERTLILSGLLLVLLALWADGTTNNDPRVTITYTDPPWDGKAVKGILAKDVVLNCYVENLVPGLDVRWQKYYVNSDGNQDSSQISRDMDLFDNIKWSIEKPTEYSWRLRIKSLALADEGNYSCEIILTDHSIKVKASAPVLVMDPPAIIQGESTTDMTYQEGERVRFECVASGIPKPTLIWRREGKAILPESSGGGIERLGGVLEIGSVTYKDRGRYICTALNVVGSASRDVYLTVQFGAKVMADSPRVGQAQGYQRTLTCYIEANPEPNTDVTLDNAQLTWTKGNVFIQSDDRQKVRVIKGAHGQLTFELTFLAVSKDDYGNYTCSARNKFSGSSAKVELYETDTPQADKQGAGSQGLPVTMATIICTVMTAIIANMC